MKMKKYLFILSLLVPCMAVAQEAKTAAWKRSIPEVVVYGQRPMKEIGAQITKFDSTALKENIALSMATS
jgi:iron complex outermembrane receptor protein